MVNRTINKSKNEIKGKFGLINMSSSQRNLQASVIEYNLQYIKELKNILNCTIFCRICIKSIFVPHLGQIMFNSYYLLR